MPQPELSQGQSRAREMVLLLRLVESGWSPHSAAAEPIARRLITARWIKPAVHGKGWDLVDEQRQAALDRLLLLWPEWEQDSALLRRLELNPWLVTSVQALPALRRRLQAEGFIHRKTWNAASSAGSKRRSQVPATARLTNDWLVRGRTNVGVHLLGPEMPLDWRQATEQNAEFAVSERSWLRSGGLGGEFPSVVVTVENVGAFVDLPIPDRGMLLFAPGAATTGAATIVRALASSIWLHFGDLDPAGMAACLRIASSSGRAPRLFIPSFAHEYLDGAPPAKNAWSLTPIDHPVLAALAAKHAWLEQESFLLDPRLPMEFAGLVGPAE